MEAARQIKDEPQLVANDNAPVDERTRPRFRLDDSDEAPRFVLTWKHADAPAELAEAFGAIAADLWIAGKVQLD